MQFLTNADFNVLISSTHLDNLTETDAALLTEAEKQAIGLISPFLTQRFDVAAALNASGPDRNLWLVFVLSALTLRQLFVRAPALHMPPGLTTLTENAMQMLNNAAEGHLNPGLPQLSNTNGPLTRFRWGGSSTRSVSW